MLSLLHFAIAFGRLLLLEAGILARCCELSCRQLQWFGRVFAADVNESVDLWHYEELSHMRFTTSVWRLIVFVPRLQV